MKVKRESEVAQSGLTLSDPMDCSVPTSFVHGIFQATSLPLLQPSESTGFVRAQSLLSFYETDGLSLVVLHDGGSPSNTLLPLIPQVFPSGFILRLFVLLWGQESFFQTMR